MDKAAFKCWLNIHGAWKFWLQNGQVCTKTKLLACSVTFPLIIARIQRSPARRWKCYTWRFVFSCRKHHTTPVNAPAAWIINTALAFTQSTYKHGVLALWLVSAERNKRRKELHRQSTRSWLSLFLHPHAPRSDWKRSTNAICGRHREVLVRWCTARSSSMRANIGVQGRCVLLRISWSALIWAQWRPKYTLLDERARERRRREKNQSHNQKRAAMEELRERSALMVLSLQLCDDMQFGDSSGYIFLYSVPEDW